MERRRRSDGRSRRDGSAHEDEDGGGRRRKGSRSFSPVSSRLRYQLRRPPRPPTAPSSGRRRRRRKAEQDVDMADAHSRSRSRSRSRSGSRTAGSRSRAEPRRRGGSRTARSHSRTRSRSHSRSRSRSRSGSRGRRHSGTRSRTGSASSYHHHHRHRSGRKSGRTAKTEAPHSRSRRSSRESDHSSRGTHRHSERPARGKKKQRRHSWRRETPHYDYDERVEPPAAADKDGSDDSTGHDDTVGSYTGKPGDYIDGRYKILREAGLGTFGRVLECLDKQRNLVVAIKVVRKVAKYSESAKIEAAILQDVNGKDVRGESLCVRMYKWFEYKGHVCLVFERLGGSLYDYLKAHDYKPFPLPCIRAYAWQLLTSLEFIHRLRLIHTDLKPENILLVDDEEERLSALSPSSSSSSSSCHDSPNGSREHWSNGRQWKKVAASDGSDTRDADAHRPLLRPPASNAVKLIDFGGATYEDESKSSIINTRQYRSPEVLLGLGWSYPSDIWSAGCILAELYLGDLLFATHENLEHLALIERCIGPLPARMVAASQEKKFFRRGRLHWPAGASSDESVEHVRRMRTLAQLVAPEDAQSGLLDLLQLMLVLDPDKRVTAKEALRCDFFDGFSMRSIARPAHSR